MPPIIHPQAPAPGAFFVELRPMSAGDRYCLVEVVRHVPRSIRWPDPHIVLRTHGYCDEDGGNLEPLDFVCQHHCLTSACDGMRPVAAAARKAA